MPKISEPASAFVFSEDNGKHLLRPGLVLVACSTAVSMPYVAAAFTQCFREGKKLGLQSPQIPVSLCLSGHARFQETVKQTLCQYRSSKNAANMIFYSTGVQQAFEWTRPEALQHVVAAMERQRGTSAPSGVGVLAMIAHQHLPEDKKLPDFKEGLLRIGEMASKSSVIFVLILVTECPETVIAIADAAVDVALVSECESDPGFMAAYAIKWYGMDMLEPSGWGHGFVQVKLEEGQFTDRLHPFCGATFVNRLIHAGDRAGRSQADIAQALGLSRSTICRHLSALKTCPPRMGAEKWYAEHIEEFKSKNENEPGEK